MFYCHQALRGNMSVNKAVGITYSFSSCPLYLRKSFFYSKNDGVSEEDSLLSLEEQNVGYGSLPHIEFPWSSEGSVLSRLALLSGNLIRRFVGFRILHIEKKILFGLLLPGI